MIRPQVALNFFFQLPMSLPDLTPVPQPEKEPIIYRNSGLNYSLEEYLDFYIKRIMKLYDDLETEENITRVVDIMNEIGVCQVRKERVRDLLELLVVSPVDYSQFDLI